MDDRVADKNCGERDRWATDELRGLLAMLDRPSDSAVVDDGLHRLATSTARLQRNRVGYR